MSKVKKHRHQPTSYCNFVRGECSYRGYLELYLIHIHSFHTQFVAVIRNFTLCTTLRFFTSVLHFKRFRVPPSSQVLTALIVGEIDPLSHIRAGIGASLFLCPSAIDLFFSCGPIASPAVRTWHEVSTQRLFAWPSSRARRTLQIKDAVLPGRKFPVRAASLAGKAVVGMDRCGARHSGAINGAIRDGEMDGRLRPTFQGSNLGRVAKSSLLVPLSRRAQGKGKRRGGGSGDHRVLAPIARLYVYFEEPRVRV